MLTVEHVHVRRRAGVVELVPLTDAARAQARALAACGLEVVRAHEGMARAALDDALDDALTLPDDASAGDRRLALACKRVLLDACDFTVPDGEAPEALRAALFSAAARARASGGFARARVVDEVAREHGLPPDDVERLLFADLPDAHTVGRIDIADVDEIDRRLDVGRLQAVLLRATRLTVTVTGTPAELRGLLRAAKLHQLLFEVESADLDDTDEAVRVTIEGPLSLFSSSTRYGLKLALLVPAIRRCRRWHIEAQVRLHKGRGVETFVAGGERTSDAPDADQLHPLAAKLLADLESGGGPFSAAAARDILRVPGTGAFVPDLVLTHGATGEQVFVEILGFWSRQAVWRRVELVERGLPFKVVFCVSDRLRVSEEALPELSSSTLVVFKGALPTARVVERALRLTAG